jgi:tetratricopeptide (TPR) repeat protein
MAVTLESLRKTVGKKKGKSSAFAWLADLERQSGDLDSALMHVTEGLSFFPDSLVGLLVESAIFFDKEQWENAGEVCRAILRKDPFCLASLRRLGNVYDKLGDVKERNQCYQRLHDLDPLNAFWSGEYAVAVETSAAAAPAAAPATAAPAASAVPAQETSPAAVPAAPSIGAAPNLAPAANAEEDPFSSLSSLLPNENADDKEISFESLEHSLDEALAGLAPSSSVHEEFPAGEISGSDISSALSGIFGNKEVNADIAPASVQELPGTPDGQQPAVDASPLSSAPSAPAETPLETPLETSAAAPGVNEDKPALEAEAPKSLSDAFDDIFGKDELPEEFVPLKPAAGGAPAAPVEKEKAPEVSASLTLDELEPEMPAPAASVTPAVPAADAGSSFFEKSSLAEADLKLDDADLSLDVPVDAKVPSEAPAVSETPAASELLVVPSVEQAPAVEKNDLPGDTPLDVDDSAESLDSLLGVKMPDVSSIETPLAEDKPAVEEPAESVPAPKAGKSAFPPAELEKAVSSSLDALFGNDDDDLPPETSAPAAAVQKTMERPSVPELPVVDEKALKSAVDSSFDALFGGDDDELSPDAADANAKTSSAASGQAAPVAKPETPVVAKEELRDAVSGAFNELFNIKDDVPEEHPAAASVEPSAQEAPKSRNGMDYLMSGDSDDTVATVLMENPSATLAKKGQNAETGLNTRTLADIYFEQGLFDESLAIYRELAKREPDDKDIADRLALIEKKRAEKLSGGI